MSRVLLLVFGIRIIKKPRALVRSGLLGELGWLETDDQCSWLSSLSLLSASAASARLAVSMAIGKTASASS